jgi:hypothetical protein
VNPSRDTPFMETGEHNLAAGVRASYGGSPSYRAGISALSASVKAVSVRRSGKPATKTLIVVKPAEGSSQVLGPVPPGIRCGAALISPEQDDSACDSWRGGDVDGDGSRCWYAWPLCTKRGRRYLG